MSASESDSPSRYSMTMYGSPVVVHAVVEDLHGVLRLELRGGARLDLEALARVGRVARAAA